MELDVELLTEEALANLDRRNGEAFAVVLLPLYTKVPSDF